MREADMKCKVAARLLSPASDHFFLQAASHLPFPLSPARLTRSRKLAAEEAFCCQLLVDGLLWENRFTLRCRLKRSASQKRNKKWGR